MGEISPPVDFPSLTSPVTVSVYTRALV
jgi:hypothetical protein